MATVKKRAWTTAKGERKEAWRVRYVDQHGETRTRQFDKKADADAYRIKAEGEVVSGVHTADRASVKVLEAAKLRIATAQANGRDRGTIKSYRELHKLHIGPLIGKERLSRLTAPKVEAFKDALLETRSAAMAHKAVRELSMIIGDAMRRGLVAQNVAAGVIVRRSKRDKKRAVIPPQAHVKAMLAAADKLGEEDPRLPVMFRLVMLTGLRQSEIRALTWEDIDLAAGKLHVVRRADRWNDVDATKSEAGNRTVPIGGGLVAALKAWKLRCAPTELGLVFPAPRGGIIDQRGMAVLMLAVQKGAGLAMEVPDETEGAPPKWVAPYGWHEMRHLCASLWISQRIDLKRLQVWIGHATIQLTIDTYGHLLADADVDAALASGAEAALLA